MTPHDPLAQKKTPAITMITRVRETANAEGQNRTADTGIFSPLLYRLSYLGFEKLQSYIELSMICQDFFEKKSP